MDGNALNLAIERNELDPMIIKELQSGELKHCPKCTIITFKIDGCNYLECSYCSTKWCFLCGKQKYIDCNEISHNSH